MEEDLAIVGLEVVFLRVLIFLFAAAVLVAGVMSLDLMEDVADADADVADIVGVGSNGV